MIDIQARKIKDYAQILVNNNLKYKEVGNYLYVGMPEGIHCWRLTITGTITQIWHLLENLVPFLSQRKVVFQIVKNYDVAAYTLNGNMGYLHIGRLISIYPSDDAQAFEIAKELIVITESTKGPVIPGEIFIGGAVYTRYINFRTGYNEESLEWTIPQGVNWPFGEIVSPNQRKNKSLLGTRYKITELIKNDAKGRVMKAIRAKGIFTVEQCLIKEGRYKMWEDDFGRDIQDRLVWQRDLHQAIAGKIPVPTFIELFVENNDMFLVTEFIQGNSLSQIADQIHTGNGWPTISLKDKCYLLNVLLKTIEIIGELHEVGFVYRDINPENFLVTDKGEVKLIDLELTYDVKNNKPYPPYEQGTPGFMSPEQERGAQPTFADDYFGLGALILLVVTGLSPNKFDINDRRSICEAIQHLTENGQLAEMISECLSLDPGNRPTIPEIRYSIQSIMDSISQGSVLGNALVQQGFLVENFSDVIETGISGLIMDNMVTSEKVWTSLQYAQDSYIGNPQLTRIISPGYETGLSGVLYFIAKSKQAGINTAVCHEVYLKSMKCLLGMIKDVLLEEQYGLYDGSAGIAIAIGEGIKSSLLTDNQENRRVVINSISQATTKIDLATGKAGQLVASLRCKQVINDTAVDDFMSHCVDEIIEMQTKDGAWPVYLDEVKKKDTILGLSYGVGGILYSLIQYYAVFPSEKVRTSINLGISYLAKSVLKHNGQLLWPIASNVKEIDLWSVANGVPGISMILLKADEIVKSEMARRLALEALIQLPEKPVLSDYTYSYGLSGLGSVYIDAYRITNKDGWRDRFEWIRDIFFTTMKRRGDNQGLWDMSVENSNIASLMTGQSGIIHFLIRSNSRFGIEAIL